MPLPIARSFITQKGPSCQIPTLRSHGCSQRIQPPAIDSTVVTAPIGLGLGRIGNFINGELYGRPSDVPWAVIFPGGGPIPRHPSQLYEALMEGAVLFIILWILRKRGFPDGMMISFFMVFYGIFRFLLEFLREPDTELGFILGPLTMGQVLSSVMIGAGIAVMLFIRRSTQPKADS
jgi:phosphatidylglycerol---prolipoprotein diacylglyceryl transferase